MTIRPDVAELLRAGYSDRAIARQLNVDRQKTVAPARAALGQPHPQPRAPRSTEDLFWLRVQIRDDGHMTWTGTRNSYGTPVLKVGGRQGVNSTAYQVAFRIANGREPEGTVGPGCGVDHCVAPACQADRVTRAENRKVDALYAGIFGESA
jgi:hypothetical protein